MNAPIAMTPGYSIPGDVAELAASRQASELLLALRAALDEQFPTAAAIDVRLESDPEIREDAHLLFELHVARADVPDFAAAKRRYRKG